MTEIPLARLFLYRLDMHACSGYGRFSKAEKVLLEGLTFLQRYIAGHTLINCYDFADFPCVPIIIKRVFFCQNHY